MSTDGLTPNDIADGLRRLARIIETDGTPGRTYPGQALSLDYAVTDLAFVVDFAEKHGLTVTFPDEETEHAWAELPLGLGMDAPDVASSAVYAGAVVLRVVYVPPAEDEDEVDLGDAARRVL